MDDAVSQAPSESETGVGRSGDYAVVILAEEALDAGDAARVRSLHEGLDQPVVYHVLLPVEDAAAEVEAALGGMSAGDMLTVPAVRASTLDPETVEAVQDAADDRADSALEASLAALREAGARAEGAVVTGGPVDELVARIKAVDGQEAIVLTRPHVVAEFFHVDWSAQARRHLDVPVLHLLEHETFDEQAGEGEGPSVL